MQQSFKQFISVKFFVYCETFFGQQVYLCGNTSGLGLWNPLKGIKLSTSTQIYPRWESSDYYYDKKYALIQFKFVIVQNLTIKRWESLEKNRTLKLIKNAQITTYFGSESMQIIQQQVINIKCREGTRKILNEMSSDWGTSLDYSSNYQVQHFYKVIRKDSGVQTEQKSSDLIDSNINLQQITQTIDEPIQNQPYQSKKFLKKNQNQQNKNGLNQPHHNLLIRTKKSINKLLNSQNYDKSEHNLSRSHSNHNRNKIGRSQSKSDKNSTIQFFCSKKHKSPILLNVAKLQSLPKINTISEISTRESILSQKQKINKVEKDSNIKQEDNYSIHSQGDFQESYIRQRETEVSLSNNQNDFNDL